MRISSLHKGSGFWNHFTFMGNVCKMRTELSSYLNNEGVECKIEDGLCIFKYDDYNFVASIDLHKEYAECKIEFQCEDEDYEKLDIDEKTFIADKVNTDLENHCIALSFNDSVKSVTSFYFTSKSMMFELFSQHFKELTETTDLMLSLVKDKIDDFKENQGHRIGFYSNSSETNHQKDSQVAAKAR